MFQLIYVLFVVIDENTHLANTLSNTALGISITLVVVVFFVRGTNKGNSMCFHDMYCFYSFWTLPINSGIFRIISL